MCDFNKTNLYSIPKMNVDLFIYDVQNLLLDFMIAKMGNMKRIIDVDLDCRLAY